MQDEILKETHALKSDINGLLLLISSHSGLVDHANANAVKKLDLLKRCVGHMLFRIRNIESKFSNDGLEEFEDFYDKFDIPRPEEYKKN